MQSAAHPTTQRAPANAGIDYTRATVFGLLVLAAAGLLLLAAALLAGDAGFAVFGTILTVVPAVLSLFVPRSRTWPLVVTAVLMVPALLFIGSAVPDSIGHPNSFFDFVPAIIGTVGALIALVSAIVALVQRRRGRTASGMSAGQRTGIFVLVGALAVLGVVSGVATLAGRTTVSAAAKSGASPVTMKGFSFKTARVNTRAGQSVRLLVKNDSPALHNFTIKQLGVAETLLPGSEKLVQLQNVAPGSYTYICTLHDGMTGTLTVT
ncbi:MAG TPA: cupredoxin domain-containing protein, partial [Dehalococcoidia bacterium]